MSILEAEVNAESSKSPSEKTFLLCLWDEIMSHYAFTGDVNRLEKTVIASRMESAKAELQQDSDAGKLMTRKCLEKLAPQANKNGATTTTIQPKAPVRPPTMDLDDFRLDFASLNGKKVRVKGIGNYMMNMFMLKGHPMDMSPIIADISKLSREQQRQILQKCSDIMTGGCNVIVFGTAGKVNFQNGIVAESVEW